MPARKSDIPPLVVIFGEEESQKLAALRRTLDELLPPTVDRGMALSEYDGTRSEEQGGPSLAAVMDDLATLPFLSDRRVVVVRDADRFITAYRERLEGYVSRPHPCAALVLACRSFPRTTRLAKAAVAAGCPIHECRTLRGRELIQFVQAAAQERGKRLEYPVAARLVELIGSDQGVLESEVEKLALFAADRPAISDDDVSDLVGLTREERIFAAVDLAGAGQLTPALRTWRGVLATDPSAVFKVVGGIAYVLRRWLAAQEMLAEGQRIGAIAPKVMMWGREDQLQTILRRHSHLRVQRSLARLAQLDAQAKVGLRSIECGVEALLVELAQ